MRTVCRLVLTLSVCLSAGAQVLARPGWAGSGVTAEPWWRRAVFYRIDPAHFQDSNGDGVGDIAGIAQRLGYIQQLGADAIILAPAKGETISTDEFGTLARKAADFHVRVMIELHGADVGDARSWLNQGAAGLYVDAHTMGASGPGALRALRKVVDSFPGERVLLASGALASADGAELSVSGSLSGVTRAGAAAMRLALQEGLDSASWNGNPLLVLDGVAKGAVTPGGAQAIQERTLAAMLLASRAAVIFDAGRELGLRSMSGNAVAMQWTPSNVTREKVEATAAKKPAAPAPEVYGAYTPYVPAPKLTMPAPKAPEIVVADIPDPDTLPGFTAGEVAEEEALNGAVANAATEDVDSNSLLNFYRHLIALHHDNGSLRNGSQTIFDRDALNALVWVRRAPAGSKTAASVVVAANLSEAPAEISLTSDFSQMHMRGGVLRPLLTASAGEVLTSAGAVIPVESAEHLVLPAFTVFLGELYHEGSTASEVPRRGTRHRRR